MKKSELYGLIGSALSSAILLFTLWFMVLSVPTLPENEGFLISFGDSFDGGGMGNNAPLVSVKSSDNKVTKGQTEQTETNSTPTKQAVFTQTENSDLTANQNEINKRMAEQKRKEQEAIHKANAVNGLFGNGSLVGNSGSGTGKGVGAGSGNGVQGNPAGKGILGVGFTLNLGNRNYLGNPVKPTYPKDVEGKITVNIRVDENGLVSSTSIGSPTTISDAEMRRDAMSAANRTRFTSGKSIEIGSITYHYKLQ